MRPPSSRPRIYDRPEREPVPYLVGLAVLVLAFPVSSGTPWLGFAIMLILLYARLRMKRVLHPDLKFGEEPPADR